MGHYVAFLSFVLAFCLSLKNAVVFQYRSSLAFFGYGDIN